MQHRLKTISAAIGLGLLASSALAAEPLKVGVTFITSGLDPAKGGNGWALVSEGVGENLFTVDKDGVLQPELASAVRRLDDLDWEVTLKPDRKFSDGTPVDAKAVSEALNHTFAVNKAALATGGVLAFTAGGPLTLEVKTEKPVPALSALFAEWPMIVYHLKSDGSASFSGPYGIEKFTPDASIDLVPNPYFPGADKRLPVSVVKFSDAQSMALAYEAGDLDLAFGLPSEVIDRLKANLSLKVKSFPVGYQYLGLFNFKHRLIADVAVRRAIDLAIDRSQLVAAINGGSPATGAFAPYFPFADKTPRPTDVNAAKALLDADSWVAGGNGLRAKAGEPLEIKILTYPQRPDLVTMLPVVKAELDAIGFRVDTAIVDNPTSAASAGDFDLFLWAQHTAPSGDPALFFNSMLRTGAGLNYGGYSNPELDKVIDKFGTEADALKRAQIASEAEDFVFKDAPILYLVSPSWYVGVSKRLENYQPWGSDYHVLRADIGETD